MSAKLSEHERRKQILDAAVKLAADKHFQTVLRRDIAQEAGCATGLISYHFGTMAKLRREVIRHAVTVGNVAVISQGLGAGDMYAKDAPPQLKAEAVEYLSRR